MADDRPPTRAVLEDARRDAEEATRTDEHWSTLAEVLGRAEQAAGTAESDAAVAALVDECARSRDFVRRGPRESGQT